MAVREVRPGTMLLLALLVVAPAWGASDPGMRAGAPQTLTGQLLIAAPEMADPRFRRTVIYMVSHDADGAFGIVINRLLGKGPMAKLLEGLELELEKPPAIDEVPIHYGGPVETNRFFVLHSRDYVSPNTRDAVGPALLTSDADIVRAIAAGKGPRFSLFAMGYAGWAPNQLEGELARDDWVVAPAEESFVFESEIEEMWKQAYQRRQLDL